MSEQRVAENRTIPIARLTREGIKQMLDVALLQPVTTPAQIEALAHVVRDEGFGQICVNSWHVSRAAAIRFTSMLEAGATRVGLVLEQAREILRGWDEAQGATHPIGA